MPCQITLSGSSSEISGRGLDVFCHSETYVARQVNNTVLTTDNAASSSLLLLCILFLDTSLCSEHREPSSGCRVTCCMRVGNAPAGWGLVSEVRSTSVSSREGFHCNQTGRPH